MNFLILPTSSFASEELVVAVTWRGVVSGLFHWSPEVVRKTSIVSPDLSVPWGVVSGTITILVSICVSTSAKSGDLLLSGAIARGEIDIVVTGLWLSKSLASISILSRDSGTSSLVTVVITILFLLV